MLRRSPRSATTLDQTKQELARQESELRDQMEKAGKIKINQNELKALTRAGSEPGL